MAEALGNENPLGYEEDFVDRVEDDFLCEICHLPLRDPLQAKCGHRFCKGCLEKHFRRLENDGQPSTCPVDRDVLNRDKPDVFADKAVERQILFFAIKCPCEGCQWTGRLRNKEDHIRTCLKYPITCPNSCGLSIPRELMPSHTRNDCPHTMTSCPYVMMGCETKVQRKQMENHLQSAVTVHLDLACVKLRDTEVKFKETQKKLNETQGLTRQLMDKFVTLQNLFMEKVLKDRKKVLERENGTFLWKIHDFHEVFKRSKAGIKETVESVIPHTATYGYNLKVRINSNGEGSGRNTHLSVFIVVMKGEYDAILTWPSKKKVQLTLIDQQEDEDERENVIKLINPERVLAYFSRPKEKENVVCGLPKFITHEKLNSRKYQANDSLLIQVEIQEPCK